MTTPLLWTQRGTSTSLASGSSILTTPTGTRLNGLGVVIVTGQTAQIGSLTLRVGDTTGPWPEGWVLLDDLSHGDGHELRVYAGPISQDLIDESLVLTYTGGTFLGGKAIYHVTDNNLNERVPIATVDELVTASGSSISWTVEAEEDEFLLHFDVTGDQSSTDVTGPWTFWVGNADGGSGGNHRRGLVSLRQTWTGWTQPQQPVAGDFSGSVSFRFPGTHIRFYARGMLRVKVPLTLEQVWPPPDDSGAFRVGVIGFAPT